MDASGRSPLIRHLPNALTTLRLAAVPVFAALMLSAQGAESPAAAAVFAFAALTDFLDGELSRRLSVQSRYGRILDPIADRLLIDVAVILLFLDDRLPLAIPVLILGRDAVLLASLAFPWARDHGVRVNPIGKAGTLVMMIGLLLAMVTPRGNAATEIVLWSGVILLLAAGVLYARAVLRARHG
ncbi:MAG: CDP-alcohol phosphatidyltransferase family protein [Actinomycetota bacterium]